MKLAIRRFPLSHGSRPLVVVMAAWALPAAAATGLDDGCPGNRSVEVHEIALPSLQVDAADYNDTKALPAADNDIQIIAARPLGAVGNEPGLLLRDVAPEISGGDDATEVADELSGETPATATSLPGIASEDLPRFRSQMFRKDI